MNSPWEARPEVDPVSRLTSKLTSFKDCLLKLSAEPQSGLDESYARASGATTILPLALSLALWTLLDSAGGASTAMLAAFKRQQVHYHQPGAAGSSSANHNLMDRNSRQSHGHNSQGARQSKEATTRQ
ncbi:TPA: hypothetical protein ACH3X3_011944 [Trebouxia sp. C0006]